jgi:hypothetical protein
MPLLSPVLKANQIITATAMKGSTRIIPWWIDGFWNVLTSIIPMGRESTKDTPKKSVVVMKEDFLSRASVSPSGSAYTKHFEGEYVSAIDRVPSMLRSNH